MTGRPLGPAKASGTPSPSWAAASTARSALRSREQSLAAPPWDRDEVWLHGDLLPGNLLVVGGRLSAVIDFGGLNVGDPLATCNRPGTCSPAPAAASSSQT